MTRSAEPHHPDPLFPSLPPSLTGRGGRVSPANEIGIGAGRSTCGSEARSGGHRTSCKPAAQLGLRVRRRACRPCLYGLPRFPGLWLALWSNSLPADHPAANPSKGSPMTDRLRPTPWRQLLESGFDTQLYAFGDLPEGPRRIEVEATTWHPKQSALIRFFRDLDSNRRYRISVFKRPKVGGYGPDQMDLSEVPSGTTLTVEIHRNYSGTFQSRMYRLWRSVGSRPSRGCW
jgi:hypothetical protein